MRYGKHRGFERRTKRSWLRVSLAAAAVAMVLSGCTAIRRDRAPEMTALLTQAGFKALPADTPSRQSALKTLTPYKVVPWKRKSGAVVYAYAEPDLCKCVYVGSARQYTTFRELLTAEEQADILSQEQAWEDEPTEFSDATIEE